MKTKRLFFLLLVLVGLVLSASVAAGFQVYKNTLYNQEQTEIQRNAEHVNAELETRLTDLKQMVELRATHPAVARHGTSDQRNALQTFVNRSSFAGVSIIHANGTMTNIAAGLDPATRRELIGADFSNRSYFRNAKNGRTTVSDPIKAESGHYIITVSTPIHRNGRIVGTLNAAFQLKQDTIFSRLTSRLERNQGLVISTSSGQTVYRDAPTRDTNLIIRNATLDETGWTVSVQESDRNLQRTLQTVSLLQIGGIILVLATISGFGGWVYRRNLKQLDRLRDGFRALKTEEYGAQVTLEGADEWHRIADGFNELSLTLDRYQTERKERQRELSETNTVLSTLLENLPVGVLVEDANREILAANERLCEIFGLSGSGDALVGRDCARAAEEMKELFDDPEAFISGVENLLDDRQPVRNEELRLADGRTLDRTYVPCSLPNGDGNIWLYRDVSQRKARERELERQEFLFERVQEIADIGVWEFDPQTGDLTWSDGVRRIHGVDEDYEPTLEEGIEFYLPEDRDTIATAIDEAIDRGEGYDMDLRIARTDGVVRDVNALCETLVDDSGATERLRGVFQDITERKDRERELERHKAYLEESTDIVTVVDEYGWIQYQSPSVERILGYEAGELVGSNGFDFIHSDDVDRIQSTFADLVEEPGKTVTVEGRFRTADDDWRWLELRGTNQLENPAINGIVTNARDITGRKEREEELREFKRAVEEAAHAVYITDIDGTIEYVNPAFEEITGYDEAEAIGRTPRILKSGAMDDEYYTDLWNTLLDGGKWEEVVPNQRANGERYYADQTIAPVCEDGEPVKFVAVQQDVTERKARKRELERYETIVANTDDVFFEIDEYFELAFVNDRIEDVLAIDREKIVGESAQKLVERLADDEEKTQFAEKAQAVLTADAESTKTELTIETDAFGELTLAVRLNALEYDGEHTGLVGVARNITERKRREQEISEIKERLNLAVEGANLGVWDWNPQTDTVTFNDQWAEMLGYTPAEIEPRLDEWESRVHPDDLPAAEAALQAHFAGDTEYYENEHRMKTADGDWKWIRDIGKVVERDDDGNPTRAVGIHLDIDERKERERELRLFSEAVEQTAHAVYITDIDGTIEYVNPAFEEQTGYDAVEVIGETPRILNSDVHDDALFREMWETITDGEIWTHEIVNERADGTNFYVDQTIAPIESDDGKIEAFVAVNRDITERKEMENELRRREARFRMMFERHSAPMLLIDPDTGAIEDANDAAVDFYGYAYDELTSKDIQDMNQLSPEEVAAERQQAEEREKNRFEFEHELASGDVRTVAVHSTPIEMEADTLLFSIIHDITASKEYEQELERYKDLVENVPVGIYRRTFGDDGTFVEVNPAMVDIFGADTKADLMQQHVSEFYADPTNCTQFSEEIREKGSLKEKEVKFETLTGQSFWGSVTAITSEDDSRTYVDGVVLDITARREYEQRLKEQRDNLEILNQMVRHDIRNDLQMVLAYAELIEEHVDDAATEYVVKAVESAENAVDLTKTARDMAEVMLQTGTDRKPVALRPVLERQIDEHRETETDATVTVDSSIPCVRVFANDMLGSVFRNLLKNAVQHNDKDVPEIEVTASEGTDTVTLRFADNGPGIPDAQKDEIFGKGEKGLESNGTGIGLYLVHTLVENYGGDVWVEDNEPDGAIFVVELPKAQ